MNLFDVLQSSKIPTSITFDELFELNKERIERFNELATVVVKYVLYCKKNFKCDDKKFICSRQQYNTRVKPEEIISDSEISFFELHNYILHKMTKGKEKYDDYVKNFESYKKDIAENMIEESLEDNSGDTIRLFGHYVHLPNWEPMMCNWFERKTDGYTNFDAFLQFADKTFDDLYDSPFSEHMYGSIQYYVDEYNEAGDIFDEKKIKIEVKERCIDRFHEYFCPLTSKCIKYHYVELKSIILNIDNVYEFCKITKHYIS